MERNKVNKLPIDYALDKELVSLIAEANLKYGEYKSNLKNSQFDSRFFLDSIILSESLKSTQIEGTQISQDDMYYLKYMPKTDETHEIQNLKDVIEYSKKYLKSNNKSQKSIQRLKIMEKSNSGFDVAEKDLELRGPGDFFGIRQSGMPEFKLANLLTDINVLKQAQIAAKEVISKDRYLKSEENQKLKKVLYSKFKEQLTNITT